MKVTSLQLWNGSRGGVHARELGLYRQRVLGSAWWWIASVPLLAERTFPDGRPLWVATTSTHFWRALITYSVDRRSMFYAWGCVRRPKQSSPCTGQSSCYLRTWVSISLQYQHSGWDSRGHCYGPLNDTWHADWSTTSRFSVNCSTSADVVSAWRSSGAQRGWIRYNQEGKLDVEGRLHGLLGHQI
jgi:hypothetical protein